MQSEQKRQVMVCPFNGEVCCDGIRKDFPKDKATGRQLTCRWWTHVRGKDPSSAIELDHFDCAIAWGPVLTIENSQMQRQTSAAVDKVATEVSKVRETPISISIPARPAVPQIGDGNP